VSARVLLIGCSLAFAVGFALIGASETVALVVLGCIVYGIGEGALIPTLQTRAVELPPTRTRSLQRRVDVPGAPRRLSQCCSPSGLDNVLLSGTPSATTSRNYL